MAFPLDKSKYIEVGLAKNLDLIDEIPPPTVYDKCNWRCKLCGLEYHKTYRAVYLGEFGCRCQNSMSLPVERYRELEEKYKITMTSIKPNNFRNPATWYSTRTNKWIEASFFDLNELNPKGRLALNQLGVIFIDNNHIFVETNDE